MSFELDESEEDLSTNFEDGNDLQQGSFHGVDEYDFNLEDSTSRSESPSPAHPSPPAPRATASTNRFKPQPERMRRQEESAFLEEEEYYGEEGEGSVGFGVSEEEGVYVDEDAVPHSSSVALTGEGDIYQNSLGVSVPGYPVPGGPVCLPRGTQVWTLYRSGEDWFTGTVRDDNGDGTWVIDYGDNDIEDAVSLGRIRLMAPPPTGAEYPAPGVGALLSRHESQAAAAEWGTSAAHLASEVVEELGGEDASIASGPSYSDLGSPQSYAQDSFDSDGGSTTKSVTPVEHVSVPVSPRPPPFLRNPVHSVEKVPVSPLHPMGEGVIASATASSPIHAGPAALPHSPLRIC